MLEKERIHRSWIDIRDSYDSGFFEDIEQVQVRKHGHTITFPAFYYSEFVTGGIFLARLKKLRKIMPRDTDLRPVQIFPGVALLVIMNSAALEADLGAYNEILIATPIYNPAHIGYKGLLDFFFPAIELFRQGVLARKMHVYIWGLVVGDWPGIIFGVDWFNMPKFKADVNYEETERDITFTCHENDVHIMTFRGAKLEPIKLTRGAVSTNVAHFYQDKLPQTELLRLRAKKGLGLSILKNGDMELELNKEHPMGREISEVLISTRPLSYFYLPDAEHIIYEPDRYTWCKPIFNLVEDKESAKVKKPAAKKR